MPLLLGPGRSAPGHAVVAAIAAAGWLALALVVPASARAQIEVNAADLVAEVAAGQSVERSGITVVGDLDLRAADHASHTFRCTDCTFSGSVIASNVTFDRIVDLSGAAISGRLELSGAIFRDAFLLSATAA